MSAICEPRFRSDGMRMIGGCIGPQPDWTWTAREWWDEKSDKWSGIDYAFCPDCEQMWDRRGGSPVSIPVGPRERTHFRNTTTRETP